MGNLCLAVVGTTTFVIPVKFIHHSMGDGGTGIQFRTIKQRMLWLLKNLSASGGFIRRSFPVNSGERSIKLP